jgi:osmotically inducible protein OsmC
MPLKENRAEVVWEGGLQDGAGRLNVASGAFPELPMTFAARTEGRERTTNPEELIAAAHATCYAMALSHHLGQNGTPPQRLQVSATSALDRVEGGLRISAIELDVAGEVPGLDPADFERLAKEAEQRCPVSNALRGNLDIRVKTRLGASAPS